MSPTRLFSLLRHPNYRWHIAATLLVTLSACATSTAFAQDRDTTRCLADAPLLRSIGTLEDVQTMLAVRSSGDGAHGDAHALGLFSRASNAFRAARKRNDYAHALALFEQAARGGDVEASFVLGFMFPRGYGIAPDFCRSRYWYCAAGARGIEQAKYALGTRCDD